MYCSLAVFAAASVAAVSAQSPDNTQIRPGIPWFDTDGNRIYAGGANIWNDNGVYYWVGEGNKVFSDCSECFNLYSSKDLGTWKFEGCVLNNSDIVAPQKPPQGFYRMERPKIFQCPGTSKYVMWFHCDTPGFTMTSVGVLTADAITGPYTFAAPCFMPDGEPSYDMGIFVDSTGDGRAYLVRSVRNQYAGISQLTEDCLNTTGIMSAGPDMEGQAIMRDANGSLHLLGSHLTGWAPNPAQFVTSPNTTLVNAAWEDNYNPTNDPTTFNSQSTYILRYAHADGHVTHMYMGDRWNEAGPGGLQNATYIWLPMVPPSGSSSPNATVGTPLALATCSASDPAQVFAFSSNGHVVHAATGLCVSAAAGAGGMLTLAECSTSAAAYVTWAYDGSSNELRAMLPAGGGCVDFNVANQYLTVANPVIAWPCGGSSPAWNERWGVPNVGNAGVINAYDQNGNPSSMCAAAQPPPAAQWTVPFLASWRLGDY